MQVMNLNNNPLTLDMKKSTKTYPLITITMAATIQTVLCKHSELMTLIHYNTEKLSKFKLMMCVLVTFIAFPILKIPMTRSLDTNFRSGIRANGICIP